MSALQVHRWETSFAHVAWYVAFVRCSAPFFSPVSYSLTSMASLSNGNNSDNGSGAAPHWSQHPYYVARRAEADALVAAHPPGLLSFVQLGPRVLSLHTALRSRDTASPAFVAAAEPLLRRLVECALDVALDYEATDVLTPTGAVFPGLRARREVVGVSIMRAGDSMESALRAAVPGARIGKLLIQRDESVAEKPARFLYSKMPPGIDQADVMLLDPMLGTGGSSICAVSHLIAPTSDSQAVALSIERVTFVCLIACAEGLAALRAAHPRLRIVAGILDECLDEHKYIRPGVGDFGDRYFGTVPPPSSSDSTEKKTRKAIRLSAPVVPAASAIGLLSDA
jgi:uracil phosphoribosyltransferase